MQKDRHQSPGMEGIGDVLGTGGPRKAEVSLGRLEWQRVVVSIDAEMIGRSSNGLPAGFSRTRYWQNWWQVAPDPIPGKEGRRI